MPGSVAAAMMASQVGSLTPLSAQFLARVQRAHRAGRERRRRAGTAAIGRGSRGSGWRDGVADGLVATRRKGKRG